MCSLQEAIDSTEHIYFKGGLNDSSLWQTAVIIAVFYLYRLYFLYFYLYVCVFSCSPNLTWRDLQHLTVLTSKRNKLHDEVHQWRRNGVGLEFNHLFGYGVLDAGGMVKLAREWKTVPERFHCVAGSVQEIQWVQKIHQIRLNKTTTCNAVCNHFTSAIWR